MKKGVNKIENQGEKWYKLLQKCQMTDFCEKIDQIYVKLSLELNVIETNRSFLQKKRGSIRLSWAYKRDPMGLEHVKNRGSIEWKFPTIFKYGSAPPHPAH